MQTADSREKRRRGKQNSHIDRRQTTDCPYRVSGAELGIFVQTERSHKNLNAVVTEQKTFVFFSSIFTTNTQTFYELLELPQPKKYIEAAENYPLQSIFSLLYSHAAHTSTH